MQDKASRRFRFTNTAISAATLERGINCGAKANYALLFDSETPRLGLRITEAGDKTFVFDGYLDRKQIRITIGSIKDWGIDKARARARELQTLIDQGTDPREAERERKEAIVAKKKAKLDAAAEEEKRQRFTLKALCLEYVAYLKTRKKLKSANDAASAFRVHVYSSDYAELPAADITPVQVAELFRKVYEAGKERTAGILRSYLTAAYNAARKAPTTATVTSGLIPFAAKAKALLETLTAGKPSVARILKAHPQTVGIRRSEICTAMGVEDFDLRDIRRTAETMMVAMGISKETRAQLLSHGLGGVQDVHYDKHSYTAEKRSALEAWEDKLESILTGKPTKRSNVRRLSVA